MAAPISLETVLERPNDKAARLVHADWLLEQGDLHGELISLQCAHDLPAASSDIHDPAPEGRKREWTLLRKISKSWLAPYRPALRFWTWHRGFVGAAQANAAKLLAATDSFTSATPLLECLFEDKGRAPFALLANAPQLAGVRRVKFFGDGGDRRSPLRSTELEAFRSRHFSQLCDLDLHDRAMAPGALSGLASAEHLTALRRLDLGSTGVETDDVIALSRAPFFEDLVELNLNFNPLGPDVIEALTKGRSLRALSLGRCGLDDNAVIELASLPQLRNLECLELYSSELTSVAARALADSKHLGKLRLVRGNIGDSFDHALRESKRFSNEPREWPRTAFWELGE